MKQLQKASLIRPESLRSDAYLESLLIEGERVEMLTALEADRIRYDLLELLAARLEHLYGKTTCSVPDEWASDLFDCLLYTLGAWLKTCPTPEAALSSLRELPVDFLYQRGLRLMMLLLADIRLTAKEVYATRISCGNGFYQSAVTKELPGFLRSCTPSKNAHLHSGYLFYTPAHMPKELSGIDYMRHYAHTLLLENRFCAMFPIEEVQAIINTPDGRVGNIFLQVLKQVSQSLLTKGIPSCAPCIPASLPPKDELLPALYAAWGNANPYLLACLPAVARDLALLQ